MRLKFLEENEMTVSEEEEFIDSEQLKEAEKMGNMPIEGYSIRKPVGLSINNASSINKFHSKIDQKSLDPALNKKSAKKMPNKVLNKNAKSS
jgi:hypothetical protein